MTDERIKEEFEKWKDGVDWDQYYDDYEYTYTAGLRTGDRLGKIEVLEELMEFIHAEHQTPSSIVAYLSRRINELKEAQS